MKTKKHSRELAVMKSSGGFTLLDVLLAILIFVVGMLALAHLQTNLTRSSTDANMRTGAAAVGEEILEELRAYRLVEPDPDNLLLAFADIDQAYVTRTVPRGGLNYSVTGTVKGYDFDVSNNSTDVVETDPAVAGVVYDLRVVELTVSWDNNPEFQVDADNQLSNTDMNTGSVTVREIIPSIPTLANAKVAAANDGELGYIPVNYTPGTVPDTVAISLDQGEKFKESTKPKPDVIRQGETVETWFDVVTYNNANIFQRREEFLVVACECELQDAPGSPVGLQPTVWNGVEYVESEFVDKPYGIETNLAQSFYCSTCCRDHHDGAAGSTPDDALYDPWKTWTSGSNSTNHDHYGRETSSGDLIDDPAEAGDDYYEACRMVRKDGFMRVTQDFRQEGFMAVPESYFGDSNNVSAYSNYVTNAVAAFYNDSSANKTMTGAADVLSLPGEDLSNPVYLPTAAFNADIDQQVSRAVYIDHINTELETLITCLGQTVPIPAATAEGCGAPGVEDYLEVVPFYEIQTTWLSLWEEDSNEDPVLVTMEPLADDNTHSRGRAELKTETPAEVIIGTYMHRGNVGLTATDPIDHLYWDNGMTETFELTVDANESDGEPPVVDGTVFSGTIGTSVGGLNASATVFTGEGGANCNLTATAFTCVINNGAVSPSLTLSGYRKGSFDLYVCDVSNTVTGVSVQSPNSTWFDLSAVGSDVTNIQFVITRDPC
jgi:type IV pilus modification protein PilV